MRLDSYVPEVALAEDSVPRVLVGRGDLGIGDEAGEEEASQRGPHPALARDLNGLTVNRF